jgi:hypothetical protein
MTPDEEEFWGEIVGAAETRVKNCFSATFFQKRNISIIDQQARCFNLCYALTKSRRVTRNSQVAIIGAGVSGMTCAVALAMAANCLVYVFEGDDILLRRFRESAFRYFHPELNANAGGQRGALSDDPNLDTDFPFMNWEGGYGPELAAQLIRKFDHYRSVACIALYLKEQIVEVAPDGQRVRLTSRAGQVTSCDLAIVATGFGKERGSELTNDESYWHSGNPRSYRTIGVRPQRSPERVLISGNGDSAVIELAHYLINDFSHHEIFRFLPHNVPPARGQWYLTIQSSLIHRRILSDVFFDEENPDVPVAAGVLGWYWNTRNRAELNPHIPLFGVQPAGAMEPRLFKVMHRLLSPYRCLDAVPPNILFKVQKRASARFEELASEELAQFARGLKLTKIFRPRIRNVMRRDVRVTVIGPSPTIYSVRQAPLNWFLLAVLEKFGKFEYRQGKLKRAAKIVRNEIRTQFGPFDRVIVRHGPKFDSLAYGLGRENESIRAFFLHEMFTHLAADKTKPRLRDVILEHFRSKHWKWAREQKQDFEDFRASETPFGQIAVAERQADNFLLGLLGTPLEEKAIRLYRRFKREPTAEGRSSIIVRIIRLTQQHLAES